MAGCLRFVVVVKSPGLALGCPQDHAGAAACLKPRRAGKARHPGRQLEFELSPGYQQAVRYWGQEQLLQQQSKPRVSSARISRRRRERTGRPASSFLRRILSQPPAAHYLPVSARLPAALPRKQVLPSNVQNRPIPQKCVHGESNPGQAHVPEESGKRLYYHYTINAIFGGNPAARPPRRGLG